MSENQKPESESENQDPHAELMASVEADIIKKKRLIKDVFSIFLIFVLVFVFRSSFFEPFRIPSGSMIPTLMIGDFILVNKTTYGLKIPFSDAVLFDKSFNPIYLTEKKEPQRGDVIVFKYPKDLSVNYIKRVVGIPGDTLEIKNKVVHINGNPITPTEMEGTAIKNDMDEKFKGYNLKFFKVKTGHAEHVIQQDNDNYYRVDYEKIIIPKESYFVMGDNRDFSYDSRYWDFVKHEQIKGKAMLVWFSLIFPTGENNFKFRPHRIGVPIL
jgi:signal peptidase I